MECMDGGPNEQDALTGDNVTVNYISFFRYVPCFPVSKFMFSCVVFIHF